MRTFDTHHGPRLPALLGGFVAVLAVGLCALVVPASAADAPGAHERPAAPSVCDAPPAAPEQALHRVTATVAGAAVRVVHACGFLPVPAPLTAARGDVRPVDPSGFATPTSGISLRVLFCTWLN